MHNLELHWWNINKEDMKIKLNGQHLLQNIALYKLGRRLGEVEEAAKEEKCVM